MGNRFTEEELALAKSVDLTAVAASLGYTVKRVGKYHTLKEMDSIRIYDRTHWFRWSRQYDKGQNGGSQIDFLRVFCGMDVKEAVWWLLDFAGYKRTEYPNTGNGKEQAVRKNIVAARAEQEKKKFVLPPPASDNNFLYQYLNEKRGISLKTIDYFVKAGLIYESRHHHNVVFKGNDRDGNCRFASMRGIYDNGGRPFKCDVEGNDKRYGFHVANEESRELVVFEGAVDLMSYMDILADFESNKLALGMLSDAPLETFLKEYPQVNAITFCLDRDEPGRKATEELMKKYYGRGYEVEDCPPPPGYKDINEWLVAVRKTARELKEREKACHEI